jgi:glutathione S-transferase
VNANSQNTKPVDKPIAKPAAKSGGQLLKLVHHPVSSGCRYVRLILGEYQQSAEFLEEKFWQRRPQLLAINPAGAVPIIVENGVDPISGAIVIGEYLDETRGALMREKRLMPDNPYARAEVRRLVDWFLVKMEQEVVQYLAGEKIMKILMTKAEGGGSPDAVKLRAGRTNLKNHLRYISQLAASRNWLAGKTISHADMAGAAALSVMDYLGEVDWNDEPAAKEWYARMKSRPSFRPLLSDKLRGLAPVSHYIDLDF